MKQILQDLRSGETLLADIPCPQVKPGHLLIQSRYSLISLGTERMLVDFGKANLLDKARQQPEKVNQVLQKIKTDGLFPTIETVYAKLDQPLPFGYCNSGVVLEVGAGVENFEPGDRVASNGPHAEVVLVPRNLCAKIPDKVSYEQAAFTVIGSIALQGVRLLSPTLGENIVVIGLGLVGQLAVQILRASGVRVLGVDFDSGKCILIRDMGFDVVDLSQGEDPIEAANAFSRRCGVDGVLVTASTKSSDPVNQAAAICRKRGRIVQVGATGLNLSRNDFYKKEISFQVSCSYGPGRYDDNYELKGQDYPYGFVRWTEQRNFEAVLNLLATGSLQVEKLITHRFSFDNAVAAYKEISGTTPIGIILEYGDSDFSADQILQPSLFIRQVTLPKPAPASVPDVVAGVIGAGNFTGRAFLPALKKTGVRLKTIASAHGVSANHLGRKFGFEEVTTDADSFFDDPDINTIFITTRHDTHARFVLRGLQAGKRVYVEKPLCLTRDELTRIEEVYCAAESPYLMVGFNRRFAPHVVKLKELIDAVQEPKTLIITVNAGVLSPDHWHQDHAVGGGRMIAEGCHFIDLLRFLVGHPIVEVQAVMPGENPALVVRDDKMSVTLRFADGSMGTVHYFGNGSRAFPKERLEVFTAGRVIQVNNFKKMIGFGWPGFRKMSLVRQNKGIDNEMKTVVESIRQGRVTPIPFDQILEAMEFTFQAVEKAHG